MCIVAAAPGVVGGRTVSTPSAPMPRRRSQRRRARSGSIRGPSTTMKSFPSPWYFTKESGTGRIIARLPLRASPVPGPPRAYLPDLLLAGGELRAGAALTVRDGAVAAVGEPLPGAEVVPLPRRLLLPGLVSAHGHSFQRAIRGRTERRGAGREDFWSWRAAMYAAANRLGPDDLEAVARMAFHELARAGATAVGEFHYLHLDPDG